MGGKDTDETADKEKGRSGQRNTLAYRSVPKPKGPRWVKQAVYARIIFVTQMSTSIASYNQV